MRNIPVTMNGVLNYTTETSLPAPGASNDALAARNENPPKYVNEAFTCLKAVFGDDYPIMVTEWMNSERLLGYPDNV